MSTASKPSVAYRVLVIDDQTLFREGLLRLFSAHRGWQSAGGNYAEAAELMQQFAADVKPADARLMAAGQRPIAEAALKEATKVVAWKSIPSYFVYGTADKNIPAQALAFMAERAGSRKTVVVPNASHVVMTSQPKPVAELIEAAATATR